MGSVVLIYPPSFMKIVSLIYTLMGNCNNFLDIFDELSRPVLAYFSCCENIKTGL
jgi:hypothetical protein